MCHNLPMCGRYRLSRRKQIIEEYFGSAPWDEDWNPRFNIAPTRPVPVIRQHAMEPVRHFALMKWGLIPHWAKEPSIATSTINAKSETAATKPTFRDPLTKSAKVSHPCGRVLRMGTKRRIQTALLLRSERWRVICICWVMGWLERPVLRKNLGSS